MVGDPAVRNRGTIGGNVSHGDPASDPPTALTALGATYNVAGPGGERGIAASDFATGLLENALEDNEILTGVSVPALAAGSGSAYVKFPHPASRYAVVGAAVIVTAQGGSCASASVVVGGVETTPTRASSVEAVGWLRLQRRRAGRGRGGPGGRLHRRPHERHIRLGRVPEGNGGGVPAARPRNRRVPGGLGLPNVTSSPSKETFV